jgi:hypothetical protein
MNRIKALLAFDMIPMLMRSQDHMSSDCRYDNAWVYLRRSFEQHIEFVRFEWMGTRYKVSLCSCNSHADAYTQIEMPGPKFNSERRQWPWMTSLISGSSGRKTKKWEEDATRHFVHWLKIVVEVVQNRGRGVWFMARPLEKRGIIPRASEGLIPFSHWGILVTPLTKGQLTDRMTENPINATQSWGYLHELRNIFGTASYQRKDFKGEDYKRATQLTYLGQTERDDEQLHNYGQPASFLLIVGHELIRQNPHYHLLTNNCQVWVEKFLEKVCPQANIDDKTIAGLLGSSLK